MINRYIKSLRAFSGLNQTELAQILNISLPSYNKKENGRVPFTVDEILLMSKYFKVPIENFFKNEVVNMNTNN